MGLMKKDTTTIIVVPAVPPLPAVPAVPFWMYATPPPLGYTYNQYRNIVHPPFGTGLPYPDGPLRPINAADFMSWSQLVLAPTQYTSTIAGYTFKTLEQVAEMGSIPPGSVPVYSSGVSTDLIGYDVPRFVSAPLPPRWYSPINYMTYVVFPDVPLAPNGYPLVPGPVVGYVDVPTASGTQRVTRTYVKDGRGVWLPSGALTNPPFCITYGSCQILMLNGFPGRAARPGVPAVVTLDYNVGWNAGANSVEAFDGDVRTRFFPDIQAAGAVGFAAPPRLDVADYSNLTHCFYFDRHPSTGQPSAAVMESGRLITPRQEYGEEMAFEIKRESGVVSYLVDDVTVYVSTVRSGGELLVGAALYRGEDGVF